MSSSEGSSHNNAVEDLCSITGLDAAQAAILLEATGGDLATAVTLHFDNEDRSNSAAATAAAMAAQEEEYALAGNAGSDQSNDDDDFPEPLPDGPAAAHAGRRHTQESFRAIDFANS